MLGIQAALFGKCSISLVSLTLVSLISCGSALAVEQAGPALTSQKEVASHVRDKVLEGDFGERTLWMTERPLNQTHLARSLVGGKQEDLKFPYPATWLVMIDEQPDANFGHKVRWLFVNAETGEMSDPVERDFPPLVIREGRETSDISFQCVPVTSKACPDLGAGILIETLKPASTDNPCLHAVLVSGGVTSASNFARYRQNLRSMYQILRGAGYAKSRIFVYYADGSSLDLDNADKDNDDATGGDLTGAADEASIRARIQDLCGSLDPNKDILLTYFSNHGSDDDGVCLWDTDNNGLQASELYSPAELAADTADCEVCRHMMIHDQCYAGDFLPLASDGDHANLVVYAAAGATESSWGRQYMAQWEQNDPGTTTVNAMHQDVVSNGNLTSTPGMAEGKVNIGNALLGDCCGFWIWRLIIIIAVLPIILIPIWWFLRSRRARNPG